MATPSSPQCEIFVSYAHADNVFVQRLTQDLAKNSLSIWVDSSGLKPGTPDWQHEIREAIRNARVLLLVATPASAQSSFVNDELLVADLHQRPIIPLWAAQEEWIDCIPLGRGRSHYIDFRGERYSTGFAELLQTLANPIPHIKPTSAIGSDVRLPVGETVSSSTQRLSEEQNRSALLGLVESFWITGVLDKSLNAIAHIDLGIEDRSYLVHPWNTTLELDDDTSYPLKQGTTITDIFDRMGKALLITGAPGAGKTTMLLELAKDLIKRARSNPKEPIPVVFNLSSWVDNKQPIEDWLIEEMYSKYQVPRKISGDWIGAQHLSLLLDGLDELKPERQNSCVEAINKFRQDNGATPLTICCRLHEFQSLRTRLNLGGAIYLQPLTPSQIDDYLAAFGEELSGVRTAIQTDANLQELAKSPLILSIMVLAYRGVEKGVLITDESIEERRHHLFNTYVKRMLSRKGVSKRYTKEQTVGFLHWLASQMSQHAQTLFLIERMQQDWLGSHAQRLIYGIGYRSILFLIIIFFSVVMAIQVGGWIPGVVSGIACAIVVAFVIIGQKSIPERIKKLGQSIENQFSIGGHDLDTDIRPAYGAGVSGLMVGLVIGLVSAWSTNQPIETIVLTGAGSAMIGLASGVMTIILISGLFGIGGDIKTIEALRWSWKAAGEQMVRTLFVTPIFGLAIFLIFVILGHPSIGLIYGVGLVIFMIAALGLLAGFRNNEIESRTIANQGVHQSLRNTVVEGLIFGSILGPLTGIVFGLITDFSHGLTLGILVGIICAFVGGLLYGGVAVLKHFVLRNILYFNGKIPWNYAQFLDYAVDRIFMQKVGGGYIFIHRLLLEYFASLRPEQFADFR